MDKPGTKSQSFTIAFLTVKSFRNTDFANGNKDSVRVKVIQKPYRPFFPLLLQRLTFGWYKAKWKYKVKLIQ